MKDILEEIIIYKQKLLRRQKRVVSPSTLYSSVEDIMNENRFVRHSMRQSLINSPSGIIAEFKRKSPSKGWIHANASSSVVPLSYYKNGAAAISILTDAQYFGGHPNFIRTARRHGVGCPILRKDFIIDEYQVFQACQMGADAILLIAACLSPEQCHHLARTSHQLQLETLLEVHTESELQYVDENIDMVGVNNRNLGTFHTDVRNSYKLASSLPSDYVLVSESGISDPTTVRELREAGFRGFLIGETFMKTADPGQSLHQFINEVTK